jgi:peptidoglycan/xylan/chitin deacetylase (PgdA/CDA1 family)
MRTTLKRQLARGSAMRASSGVTVLIYHRVGAGTTDERDLALEAFREQIERLSTVNVCSLNDAVTELGRNGVARDSRVVLTFDDGFLDVYENAWPLLRRHDLPFTIYLATAYVGGEMHWEGSTAKAPGRGLTWGQLEEMVDSGLCTIGNHTHTHARPEALTTDELDRCSDEVERHLGVRPEHFAYTWGIPVPSLENDLRARFRSAATGKLGRNLPGADPMRLRRIPVRRTDPIEFFQAKLTGNLWPERTYAALVWAAKKAGASA